MTATQTMTRLECDCTECAKHAARFGKSLPLAVEAPTAWLDGIAAATKIRGPRGYSKGFRHSTVQMGHEQSAISRTMRERCGVTPVGC